MVDGSNSDNVRETWAAARHPDCNYSPTPAYKPGSLIQYSPVRRLTTSVTNYLLLCLPRPANFPPAVFLRVPSLPWFSLLPRHPRSQDSVLHPSTWYDPWPWLFGFPFRIISLLLCHLLQPNPHRPGLFENKHFVQLNFSLRDQCSVLRVHSSSFFGCVTHSEAEKDTWF
ncbi:hypothetical protein NQZ68_025942 [Dissostichus eleginoides]|nr:hypothetical protein NQZ68_025942 [Dissostichus eleginoides]